MKESLEYRDLQRAISSNGELHLLDRTALVQVVGDYINKAFDVAESKELKLIRFRARQFNEQAVIDAILKENTNLQRPSSNGLSDFRKAAALLEASNAGIICIVDAENLSVTAQTTVSRLRNFVRREKLAWQFVMIADIEQIDELMYMQFSADNTIGKAPRVTIESEKSWLNQKPSATFSAVSAISFLFLAGVIFQTFFSADDNSTQGLSQTNISSTETVKAKPKQGAALAKNSLIYQEKEIETQVEDAEFYRMLSEIEAPKINSARVTLSGGETVPVSESRVHAKQKISIGAEFGKALLNGDLAGMKKLLEQGSPINAVNEQDQTPLVLAVIKQDEALLELLIKNEASLNETDRFGRSALFYASIDEKEDIVRLLLNAGADVNLRSDLSKTPLMAATHNGNLEIAKLLLSRNADIDAQDHSGWSALFYAIWNKNAELTQLLVESGADLNLIDKDGYTPKTLSALVDSEKISRLFAVAN